MNADTKPDPDPSDIKRPIPMHRHPVVNREYRIPTPAIDAFYLLIQRALRFRSPGAIVYGRARFGKSRAIEFHAQMLGTKYANLPVLRLTCQRKKTPSELAFFANLLTAASHKATTGGTTTAVRQRLNNRLREIAERSNANRIVLFADDAQRLFEIEYEWLQEVHDELRKNSVSLVTFLVGTPLLRGQKSLFQSQGLDQLVARFMVDDLPFRGLLGAQDCATCMHSYDVTIEPAKSTWTYTQFFLPKAFDAGLRLGNFGAAVWDAFVDAHHEARLPGDVEIPMEYFTRTIEFVLTEYVDADTPTFKPDARMWTEAVRYSGFHKALELTSPGLAEP